MKIYILTIAYYENRPQASAQCFKTFAEARKQMLMDVEVHKALYGTGLKLEKEKYRAMFIDEEYDEVDASFEITEQTI